MWYFLTSMYYNSPSNECMETIDVPESIGICDVVCSPFNGVGPSQGYAFRVNPGKTLPYPSTRHPDYLELEDARQHFGIRAWESPCLCVTLNHPKRRLK